MNFSRESLFDVSEDVKPLLEAHYLELTRNKDVVKLAPRWDQYSALEQAGMFVILTARDGEQLVGYNAFFLMPHMHYEGLMLAQNDVFYLREDRRKGTAALRFLRYSEEALRALGADKIVYHCKPTNNFAPILHRLGYSDEEVMTGKLIKGA